MPQPFVRGRIKSGPNGRFPSRRDVEDPIIMWRRVPRAMTLGRHRADFGLHCFDERFAPPLFFGSLDRVGTACGGLEPPMKCPCSS